MFGISPVTMVILLFIGVLLFGKDLPDVARRVGKSLLDFRRSLQGLHDEVLNDRPEPRPVETGRPTAAAAAADRPDRQEVRGRTARQRHDERPTANPVTGFPDQKAGAPMAPILGHHSRACSAPKG